MKKITLFLLAASFVMASCTPKQTAKAPELIPASNYDTVIDGKKVELYTIENKNGMAAQITNYGARVVSLWAKDRAGDAVDVLLGFDNIAASLNPVTDATGMVVGRYANRIAKGKFTLNGKEYTLATNNGPNHLHGGIKGFSKYVWDGKQGVNEAGEQQIVLTMMSPDGDEGYPGNLNLQVTYTLTNDNALKIDYLATTDAPTVINFTNHAYFNLHGDAQKSPLSHVLMINSDSYTPTDSLMIPTGEIATLDGTPLDFRTPTVVGDRIDADFEALNFGQGYDHNWIIKHAADGDLAVAAELYEPENGIVMKVLTTEPGMQLYSGNHIKSDDTGKYGARYSRRGGLCFETQHFPDSPNHDNFPSTVLTPEKPYTQTTTYQFEVK